MNTVNKIIGIALVLLSIATIIVTSWHLSQGGYVETPFAPYLFAVIVAGIGYKIFNPKAS